MDLLLFGARMGVVGGLIPSPLHLIALSQVALNRWVRGILILLGPPLIVDGVLLLVTFLFYQSVPQSVARVAAYVGGVVLTAFGVYSLIEMRRRTKEELGQSSTLTYASVTVATMAQLAAPGTWIYWLTIAGPFWPKDASRATGTSSRFSREVLWDSMARPSLPCGSWHGAPACTHTSSITCFLPRMLCWWSWAFGILPAPT